MHVENHLAGCATCRAEVDRLTAATDAIAESVLPVTPPPDARRRLLARIAAERAATKATAVPTLTTVTTVSDSLTGAPRATAIPTTGSRAGAGTGAWQAATGQRELAVALAEVTRLRAQLDDLSSALAEISATGQPGTPAPRVTALQGVAPASSSGGRLVFQPSGRAAIALLERLPALEPGRVYQLWLLRGSAPTPAGTFVVDSTGRASAVLRAPDRLDTYSGIGLTAEPAPGGPVPTGPILASASLAPP